MSPPARFEQMVASVTEELWLQHEWIKPELDQPTRSGDPRGVNFERDVAMAGMADVVLALFPEEEMLGGTEHLVEKAIDQGIPVYSYGVRDGQLIRIGEHDPAARWADQVPKG